MENYFLDYDKVTGDIKGFYLKSIHGLNIPENCLEITPEKHDFYMQNNGLYMINITTLEDELIPIVAFIQGPSLQSQINDNAAAISMLMGV